MFANIFAKTLRDQRHGLIGWGAGIAVTMFVMAAIWPSFSDMDFDAMLAQEPAVGVSPREFRQGWPARHTSCISSPNSSMVFGPCASCHRSTKRPLEGPSDRASHPSHGSCWWLDLLRLPSPYLPSNAVI